MSKFIDTRLKNAYNNIKDPSWDDISLYDDYIRLPLAIRNECEQDFGMLDVINDNLSVNTSEYLANNNNCLCFENVAFVPVPKTASSTYYNLFRDQLNWETKQLGDINWDNTTVFGLMQSPIVRHVKGIVEFFVESFEFDNIVIEKLLNDDTTLKYLMNLLRQITVGDVHSLPCSTLFGKHMNKINWIPITNQSPAEVNQMVTDFLTLQNISIDVGTIEFKNVAYELRTRLVDLFVEDYQIDAVRYNSLSNDMAFYNKLLESHAYS